MKYQNPVLRGNYPDPSICRVGDTFYMVNSTMEYLPGLPLFMSKDLVNWKQVGHCLTRPEQADLTGAACSGGIYAPTIRCHEGVFYVVTTNVYHGTFVISSTDPANGFSDPVFIDIAGIDPSLYFEDKRCYIQISRMSCIAQAEVDLKTGKLLSEPQIITYGCGGRDVEGPHIYKIGEYYYLFCAEGGTREGHMETVQRSRNIYGPYEPSPYHPFITNRDQKKELIQSVGHADLIDDPDGNWWIVALATRTKKHMHHLGRETVLVPVMWDAEKWPYVADGCAKELTETEKISGEQIIPDGFYDSFDNEKLRYDYCGIRKLPQTFCYVRPSHGLILTGTGESLDTLGTPAFLGVRQTEYRIEIETAVTAELEENGTAGVCVLMDNLHHMEIGVKKDGGRYAVYMKKTVDDIVVTNTRDMVDERSEISIILGVRSDGNTYNFYYKENKSARPAEVGNGLVKHLTTEVSDSPFVGVYCGMFVENQGKAAFRFFSYRTEK